MQNHYSLVYREEEREMMPTLQHFGVGSIPWSPLARGFLTRPYNDQAQSKRSESDWYISLARICLSMNLIRGAEQDAKVLRNGRK